MPRYLVIHHAPGVTPEDFQRSVPAVLEGKFASFVQCYANMVDGVIVNLYDGESEQAVARELERIGSRSTRSRSCSSPRRRPTSPG
ncbi:MAG TPA: hypothetical protein VHW23_10175 [Kofleriaceae bacterium]|jgi:hypothetical protein|nr:hypothetical protein [Kofleriaceae bacterium]